MVREQFAKLLEFSGLEEHFYTVKVISSILIGATKWVVSSMVEQWTVNPEAIGSSPILPADLKNKSHERD